MQKGGRSGTSESTGRMLDLARENLLWFHQPIAGAVARPVPGPHARLPSCARCRRGGSRSPPCPRDCTVSGQGAGTARASRSVVSRPRSRSLFPGGNLSPELGPGRPDLGHSRSLVKRGPSRRSGTLAGSESGSQGVRGHAQVLNVGVRPKCSQRAESWPFDGHAGPMVSSSGWKSLPPRGIAVRVQIRSQRTAGAGREPVLSTVLDVASLVLLAGVTAITRWRLLLLFAACWERDGNVCEPTAAVSWLGGGVRQAGLSQAWCGRLATTFPFHPGRQGFCGADEGDPLGSVQGPSVRWH